MSDPCTKCGYRVDWCRCRYKHRDKSERSNDQTWTLFTRLWKRIVMNRAHEVMWSEATIRALLLKHPLPWHTDQDWTWEILDSRDTYVTGGFRHEIDALEYIEKARTVMPTLTDEQLRELYARYCECRDIDGAVNTARLTHSHDCYCDVLADIRTALHGFIWMDGEPIAVSDATRAAARERLVTAWRDYEEEAAHLAGRTDG